MKLVLHLIRLLIFSFFVSLGVSGVWVTTALSRPDLTNQATDLAWNTVEFVYAAFEYSMRAVLDEGISDRSALDNLSGAEFSFTESSPLDLFSPTRFPESQFRVENNGCIPPDTWEIYFVQAEDTLQDIAAILLIDIEIIQSANCMFSAEIFIGQVLFVPSLKGLTLPLVSPTVEQSITPTTSSTVTFTVTASFTTPATLVATPSPSPYPTIHLTHTPVPTKTSVPVPSATPVPTNTIAATPSSTPNPTNTSSPAATSTDTVVPDATPETTSTRTPTPISSPSSPTPTSSGPSPTATVDLSGCSYNIQSSFENQVLDLLNLERAKVGLPALIMQNQLKGSAREHSADMACNSFVSHTGSNGTSSYDRITSYGYYPSWWGENIYKGWQTTPEEVVDWWMNSEPHRKNILHSYFLHIGIGAVAYGNSVAYTLNFGRP